MALDVKFPESPFEDFDTFFTWYLDTVERNMPVPMSEIHASNDPSSYSTRLIFKVALDLYCSSSAVPSPYLPSKFKPNLNCSP